VKRETKTSTPLAYRPPGPEARDMSYIRQKTKFM
jgi:hypothetical protein